MGLRLVSGGDWSHYNVWYRVTDTRELTLLNAGYTNYFKADCELIVLNHSDRGLKKNINKRDDDRFSS